MSELTIDRPIKGDIARRNWYKTAQQGPAEFLAALDRALAVPGVEAIIWDQYTPYFNDGEPCEFSVNDPRIVFEGADEDDEYSDYGDGSVDSWSLDYYREKNPEYLPKAALALTNEETEELRNALNFSPFEDVLEANFGDHAQVTATREGFNVEYYEHD